MAGRRAGPRRFPVASGLRLRAIQAARTPRDRRCRGTIFGGRLSALPSRGQGGALLLQESAVDGAQWRVLRRRAGKVPALQRCGGQRPQRVHVRGRRPGAGTASMPDGPRPDNSKPSSCGFAATCTVAFAAVLSPAASSGVESSSTILVGSDGACAIETRCVDLFYDRRLLKGAVRHVHDIVNTALSRLWACGRFRTCPLWTQPLQDGTVWYAGPSFYRKNLRRF